MYLLLAFVFIPLIEIALFIQVGGAIGLWPTLAVVILTAIVGTWLVRLQGRDAIADLNRSFSELRDPTKPLADGAMILFSGALLLTPGFFTDAVGFALLMPPVRRVVYDFIRQRLNLQRFRMGQGPQRQPERETFQEGIMDGEFSEIHPDTPKSDRPSSGWRRH